MRTVYPKTDTSVSTELVTRIAEKNTIGSALEKLNKAVYLLYCPA